MGTDTFVRTPPPKLPTPYPGQRLSVYHLHDDQAQPPNTKSPNSRAIHLTLLALLSLALSAQQTPRPAPPLTFSLPNKPNQTLDQFRGKVIALEFIFTTCPHCQAASHLMSKLQTEYGPRGLQVLDIAINPNADLKVEDFAREQQTTFPVGWANQSDMTAFMSFGSDRYVVPQLVLIDRKGVIHYQTPAMESDAWDKLMTEESIRKHIEELLGAKRK